MKTNLSSLLSLNSRLVPEDNDNHVSENKVVALQNPGLPSCREVIVTISQEFSGTNETSWAWDSCKTVVACWTAGQ